MKAKFDARMRQWLENKTEDTAWNFITDEQRDSIIARLEEIQTGNVKLSNKDRRLQSRFCVMTGAGNRKMLIKPVDGDQNKVPMA